MFQKLSTIVADTLHPWRLEALSGFVPPSIRSGSLPAQVPGCVHTDLLHAGLIPDPYLDRNEETVQWIGRTAWRYSTQVDLAPVASGERVELVFDGLDTVCEVRLGHELLGSPRNMHRAHEFDVTSHAGTEGIELTVEFAPQADAAEQASEDLTPRVHNYPHPFNAVRKMACNFGWDWGPDLITAGIWRPVWVRRWRTARLDGVRPSVTVSPEGSGLVTVHADILRAAPGELRMRIDAAGCSSEVRVDGGHGLAQVEVPEVDLWWPRGYGDQPRYDLTVVLLDDTGEELDAYRRRIGFRTVELDTSPDDRGTAFTLRVNGRPILVKGANWIPDDCFPSRLDRARYISRIDDAVGAGANLLRVWGGGIYESDDFYDACDERGLLVWQDFLFACAAYAEEAPLAQEVMAEATAAITRLAPHPSLVLWNGNNENLWGHEDWGWKTRLGDLSWGRGYYLELLPRLVAELDGTRPYSPGSPWSFDERLHPNDPAHGTTHIWDVWNTRDYTAYRDYVPRFVAEFGYQGPPTWATLIAAVHDDPLTPLSAGLAAHQKAADGMGKLARGLVPHLPLPDSMTDWHWAMSVQQARAVTFGIEHFRSWQPTCMGMIVWQLNDCWPVISWSAIDGYGRRKPLWYALRQSYAARLLTIQPRGRDVAVVACNDTDEPWAATIQLRRLTLDGASRAAASVSVIVPARAVDTIPIDAALLGCEVPAQEVLVAQTPGSRALWFFAADRDLHLSTEGLHASARATSHGYAIDVVAQTLQRDVCLLVDKVDPDAIVDNMMLTLLPGERHTFHVESQLDLDPGRFLDPDVLRTVNQLVRPA